MNFVGIGLLPREELSAPWHQVFQHPHEQQGSSQAGRLWLGKVLMEIAMQVIIQQLISGCTMQRTRNVHTPTRSSHCGIGELESTIWTERHNCYIGGDLLFEGHQSCCWEKNVTGLPLMCGAVDASLESYLRRNPSFRWEFYMPAFDNLRSMYQWFLFQANEEFAQLMVISRMCGTPCPSVWPEVKILSI